MRKLSRVDDILGRARLPDVYKRQVYYHSWYRDPSETGGLFLQKATHDIDYIHFLTGERPVSVCAKTAKLHFKGDRPAGLHCPDCPDYRTCPESSYVVGRILKEDVQGLSLIHISCSMRISLFAMTLLSCSEPSAHCASPMQKFWGQRSSRNSSTLLIAGTQ